MNKKFYVSPVMEVEEVELERCVMLNESASDPIIHDEYSDGDPDD